MFTIVTHDGGFHTDEVFAVATLQLHLGVEYVHVLRTREEYAMENADWVIDIGGIYDPSNNYFDHHQVDAPVRENGIPYSSFGLIWKEYGEQVCDSREAMEYLEEKIVIPVDAGDNGVSLYTLNEYNITPFELYNVIRSFTPTDFVSPDEVDKAFMQAVDFARHLLERLIIFAKAQQEKIQEAEEVYKNAKVKNGILIIDKPIGTSYFSSFSDVAVIVKPESEAEDCHWLARAVPVEGEAFVNKAEFPENWAGLQDKELQKTSGIDDAIFCHRKLFIFVAKSKEGALKAAQEAAINI